MLMKRVFFGRLPGSTVVAFLLAISLARLTAVAAEVAKITPAGIVLQSETRTNPSQRWLVAQVNLKTPGLRLRVVPGGLDPDGPGKWQTTLMQPTKIAEREKFDLVINGDFFKARDVSDAEGTNSAYRASLWALAEGPAMTDGKTWSTCSNSRPCLVVHTNQTVAIESLTQPDAEDWEVVGGNALLVHNGAIVPHSSKLRHPRTVVGLDATGIQMTILVVDGRKPGIALGMTYDELATEMVRLGCTEAINLDGGGSSLMAVRDPETHKMKILNDPTDGHERAVVNVLGISVEQN